jgi:hypothetical protein
MRSLAKWTLLLAVPTLTACQTPTNAPDLKPIILKAVCDNLVPISGKSTDDPLTRQQVKRQNARVLNCPPDLRRKPEL